MYFSAPFFWASPLVCPTTTSSVSLLSSLHSYYAPISLRGLDARALWLSLRVLRRSVLVVHAKPAHFKAKTSFYRWFMQSMLSAGGGDDILTIPVRYGRSIQSVSARLWPSGFCDYLVLDIGDTVQVGRSVLLETVYVLVRGARKTPMFNAGQPDERAEYGTEGRLWCFNKEAFRIFWSSGWRLMSTSSPLALRIPSDSLCKIVNQLTEENIDITRTIHDSDNVWAAITISSTHLQYWAHRWTRFHLWARFISWYWLLSHGQCLLYILTSSGSRTLS